MINPNNLHLQGLLKVSPLQKNKESFILFSLFSYLDAVKKEMMSLWAEEHAIPFLHGCGRHVAAGGVNPSTGSETR
jgi:hypothetical protein